MRKDFFFGFLSVNDWEYLWGRTKAQIELRTIDQPLVVYKSDNKKETPWKNGKVSEDYASIQYHKWLEKKKLREKQNKKIDFMKYLQTPESSESRA